MYLRNVKLFYKQVVVFYFFIITFWNFSVCIFVENSQLKIKKNSRWKAYINNRITQHNFPHSRQHIVSFIYVSLHT